MFLAAMSTGDVDRYRKDNLLLENIPEIPVSVASRLQPYQNVRAASFRGWLPRDGGILIRTRFGESAQIHVVESPGGMRRQITFFDEPAGECKVCPAPNKEVLLLTKDTGVMRSIKYTNTTTQPVPTECSVTEKQRTML